MAREIVEAYARRWTIEPSFRDTKDIRFGMGMSAMQISRPDRVIPAVKSLDRWQARMRAAARAA